MNRQEEKRKRIFIKFAKNLEYIKTQTQYIFEPDINPSYICPLCLEVFELKDIKNNVENPLTLEDTPPKSMGGKPILLTCKACNNKSGTDLDSHLLNKLNLLDAQSFLPDSQTNAKFFTEDGEINGEFNVSENGTVIFDFHKHRTKPGTIEDFINNPSSFNYDSNLFNIGEIPTYENKYKIKFTHINRHSLRNAEVALLRIAYLKAFSVLGYCYVLFGGCGKIRAQIADPQAEILPPVFWLNYEFSDDAIGIHVIKKPLELQGFLVVFKLKSISKNRNFGIVLPGHGNPGLKVYDFLSYKLTKMNEDESVVLEYERISDLDYLTDKNLIFSSQHLWDSIIGESL